MLANDPLYITPDDYLAAEEVSPMRHEYHDGEVFAMTGGTLNHNTIIIDILPALKRRGFLAERHQKRSRL
jgi:Uma2 family endonuclease